MIVSGANTCKEKGPLGTEAKAPPYFVVVGVELKVHLEPCEACQQWNAPIRDGTKIPTEGGGSQPCI